VWRSSSRRILGCHLARQEHFRWEQEHGSSQRGTMGFIGKPKSLIKT